MLRVQNQPTIEQDVENLDHAGHLGSEQWAGAWVDVQPESWPFLWTPHSSQRKKKSNYYPSSIYATKISTK